MIRCLLRIHRYDDPDTHGRKFCVRCGKRQPVKFATIPDPALDGRQLSRPKTRRQR